MTLGIVLLLALLFVTIGFIGGALITMVFSDREADKISTPSQKEDGEVDRKYKNLINLYRDPSSGNLVLGVGGKPYRDRDQLSKKDRRDLVMLAREWLDWLGVSNEMQKRLEELAHHPQPETAPPAPPTANFPEVATQFVLPPVPAVKEKKATLKEKENKAAATTIVGQIDAILQDRLAGSPLEGRNIKLTEDTREGVVVCIGVDRYLGVDSVPDLEVREEIKAAVSVWEQRLERDNP